MAGPSWKTGVKEEGAASCGKGEEGWKVTTQKEDTAPGLPDCWKAGGRWQEAVGTLLAEPLPLHSLEGVVSSGECQRHLPCVQGEERTGNLVSHLASRPLCQRPRPLGAPTFHQVSE